METKKFEFGEAISFGWTKTKENFMLLFLIILFMLGLQVVSSVMQGMVQSKDNPNLLAALIISLAFVVVGMLLKIGITRVYLQIHDGKPAVFNDIFNGADRLLDFFLTGLLVGLIILLGFLLLIIPGIIWSIKYQFAIYNVIDRGMKPMEAIRESARMTDGQKGQLFLFGFVLALFNLAGLLCLVVGLLFTLPASAIATVYVYRKLMIPVPMVATNTAVATPQF